MHKAKGMPGQHHLLAGCRRQRSWQQEPCALPPGAPALQHFGRLDMQRSKKREAIPVASWGGSRTSTDMYFPGKRGLDYLCCLHAQQPLGVLRHKVHHLLHLLVRAQDVDLWGQRHPHQQDCDDVTTSGSLLGPRAVELSMQLADPPAMLTLFSRKTTFLPHFLQTPISP